MQKFGNLDKWLVVKAGTAIKFDVTRRVKLELVAPVGTNLFVTDGFGKDRYFTSVSKDRYFTSVSEREVIEFEAISGMSIKADKDIRYYSSENEFIHVEETGNPSYAKVANRQQRNPELERVAALAAQNATRRMEQMYLEEQRRKDAEIAALRRQANAERPSNDGSSDRASVQPASKDNPASSGGLAAEPAGTAKREGGNKGDDVSDGSQTADG